MGHLPEQSRVLCHCRMFAAWNQIMNDNNLNTFANHTLQTSQLIEVVTWRFGDPTLIHSLRAHTRVITDIDWHSKVPHLLASCSIDTFTHLWDLRDPRKPIMSLSAVCMCTKSVKRINYSLRLTLSSAFSRRHTGWIQSGFGQSTGDRTWRRPSNMGSTKGIMSDTIHYGSFGPNSWHQLESSAWNTIDNSQPGWNR